MRERAHAAVTHHHAVPTTNVAPSRDAACDRFAAHRSAFRRDGYAIIRNFLNHRVVAAIQKDLETIVDGYANSLRADGRLAGANGRTDPSAGLPFSQRYTELYRANKFGPANQGRRSDLPAFFRKEGHTPGVHSFIADAMVLELARCVMPTAPPRTRPLRLYPVYMLRGKPPDALTGAGGSVDWHQDAEYTYYWYSDLNTSRAQLDEYASSIVNFWVPITDTPHELGPVQFARRPSHSERTNGVGGALTRADMRCRGCDDQERLFKQAEADLLRDENLATGGGSGLGGGGDLEAAASLPAPPLSLRVSEAEQSVEWLRISDVDAYVSADHSRLVTAAPLRRGDVVIFDQYMYHRGLPNLTPNSTRWSLDFRFQDSAAPTLRSETGFIIQSPGSNEPPLPSERAPRIANAADWARAKPSLRLSDLRHATGNPRLGGHDWAAQHMAAETLLSAVDLERRGYQPDEPAAQRVSARAHGRRLSRTAASRPRVLGSVLRPSQSLHD